MPAPNSGGQQADVATVQPGETFTYTIQFHCPVGTVNGCIIAAIREPLPQYVSLNGALTIVGSTSNPSIDSDPPIVVTFNDDLGGGQVASPRATSSCSPSR